jgi:hypothetical protein
MSSYLSRLSSALAFCTTALPHGQARPHPAVNTGNTPTEAGVMDM